MVAVGPPVEERVEEVEDVAVVAVETLLVGFVVFKGRDPVGVVSILCDLLQDLNLSCVSTRVPRRRTPPGSAASSS